MTLMQKQANLTYALDTISVTRTVHRGPKRKSISTISMSPILELPREIRQSIYDYLVPALTTIDFCLCSQIRQFCYPQDQLQATVQSLVSSQISQNRVQLASWCHSWKVRHVPCVEAFLQLLAGVCGRCPTQGLTRRQHPHQHPLFPVHLTCRLLHSEISTYCAGLTLRTHNARSFKEVLKHLTIQQKQSYNHLQIVSSDRCVEEAIKVFKQVDACEKYSAWTGDACFRHYTSRSVFDDCRITSPWGGINVKLDLEVVESDVRWFAAYWYENVGAIEARSERREVGEKGMVLDFPDINVNVDTAKQPPRGILQMWP